MDGVGLMAGVAHVPGATVVAGMIRKGTLTATEHVTEVLDAIDRTQSEFASWAYVDREGAVVAAQRADALLHAGVRTGPLHGVAVGVKDVIAVAGMPTRAGSKSTSVRPCVRDAVAVERLRAAGAVIVGKTTTHEFASGQGDPGTVNPRFPDRYAGGSSVGSGVAVAVGSVPAALGTDTGGSIRNPAAVNGVVGFKPSRHFVDARGLLHFSRTLDVVGPIAPSVADCRLVATALSGATREPPRSSRPVRLAVDRSIFDSPALDDGFKVVLADAIDRLVASGVEFVECRDPDFGHAMTAALVIGLTEFASNHVERLSHLGVDYLPETRHMVETGLLLEATDLALAERATGRITRTLAELARSTGADALIGVTLPAPPPLIREMSTALTAPVERTSLSSALQHLSLANLTGLPAITVPAGEALGQPVGLHLTGLNANDFRLLDVAEEIEEYFLGFTN